MNKTSLTPKQEKEMLIAAKPVAAIFSAISSLQKKISVKEKEPKNKRTAEGEIEKLKVELKKKKKELEKMGEKKLVEGKEAIRSLVKYNRNLVKYIGRRFASFGGKIDPEELIFEGISSLLKAIEKFDVDRNYCFATYEGYWITQYMRTQIIKNQLINQGPTVKEKKNVIYYDNSYQNDDNESKSYSLIETLDDSDSASLTANSIRQKDSIIQVNSLINSLENREAILLIRLGNKIMPSNLLDIYYMATDEGKKKLKKSIKLGAKADLNLLKQYSLQDEKNSKLAVTKNYLAMMSRTYKSSELAKLLNKSENSVRKLKQDSLKKLQTLAKERKLHLLLE